MQVLFNIITCILGMVSMLIFFHTFFDKRKQQIPLFVLPFCFFTVELLTSAIPVIVHTPTESLNTILLTLFSFLLTLLLTYLYSATLRHRLFITLSYHVICILSEVFVYTMFPASQVESLVSDSQQSNYLWSLLSACISLCITIVLCHILRMCKHSYSVKYTAAMLITPILSIGIIIVTIDHPDYRIHGTYLYQLCLILCLFIVNAVHYYLFNYVVRSNQLASENQSLQEQIDFQTNKYQQISTAYKNTRSMLHDTKQHFLYLESCIESENYAAMKEYLPTAIKNLEQSYNRINTGNLVIDAFVSNYLSIAENENITFHTDIKVDTNHIPVSDYDLCIILGNLLDNCIHAVRQITPPKERKITVQLFTKDGNFVIHITNSYYPEEHHSKKEDSLLHGYGCKNVEQITLKSNGSYSCWIENETYTAIVSLPYEL